MSESDYQRGLRGAECNVSIGDHERWNDWKTGHDEFEREQDARDEVLLAQTLTKGEQIARIDARVRARKAEELASAIANLEHKAEERERAHNDDIKSIKYRILFLLILFFIIGIIVGAILYLIFKIPVVITILGSLAIGYWVLSVEDLRPYKIAEGKRQKDAAADDIQRKAISKSNPHR